MAVPHPSPSEPISVSVVIPVYRGESTLPGLIEEMAALHEPQVSPHGRPFTVSEVLLVWDRGPGGSDATIRMLDAQYEWVRPVWLSRNFGQHAATLAGMTSSGGDWIVTLDEDGQMDPSFIGAMLDTAYERNAQLVYGSPTNPPPHGALRNAGSKFAKGLFVRFLADRSFEEFNSYRLVLGEVGRSVAAYTGAGVYLDVALSWVVADVTTYPVTMRSEGREAGNYSYSRLFSHFGRLIVSSGTKPLFFVTFHRRGFRDPRWLSGAMGALPVHRRRPSRQRLGIDVHRVDGRRRSSDDEFGHHRPIHRGRHQHVPRKAALRGCSGPRPDLR